MKIGCETREFCHCVLNKQKDSYQMHNSGWEAIIGRHQNKCWGKQWWNFWWNLAEMIHTYMRSTAPFFSHRIATFDCKALAQICLHPISLVSLCLSFKITKKLCYGGDVDDYISNSTAAAVQGIYLQSQHKSLTYDLYSALRLLSLSSSVSWWDYY